MIEVVVGVGLHAAHRQVGEGDDTLHLPAALEVGRFNGTTRTNPARFIVLFLLRQQMEELTTSCPEMVGKEGKQSAAVVPELGEEKHIGLSCRKQKCV